MPKLSVSGCRGTRLSRTAARSQSTARASPRRGSGARRSSRWRPLPGARWVKQSVPASDRCLRIVTILHSSRPALLSANARWAGGTGLTRPGLSDSGRPRTGSRHLRDGCGWSSAGDAVDDLPEARDQDPSVRSAPPRPAQTGARRRILQVRSCSWTCAPAAWSRLPWASVAPGGAAATSVAATTGACDAPDPAD